MLSGTSGALYGSFKTAFKSAVQHAREQRAAGIKTFGRVHARAHARCDELRNPSKLDFEPRLKFRSRPRPGQPTQSSSPSPASRCAPHPTEPCPTGTQESLRRRLLEVWLAQKFRYQPHTCAVNGRAAQTHAIGGNGGGKFRVEFDNAKEAARRHRHRHLHPGCRRLGRPPKSLACSTFSKSQHAAGRFAPALASGTATTATPHATQPPHSSTVSSFTSAPPSSSRPTRPFRSHTPPRCNTRLYTPGLYTSIPKLTFYSSSSHVSFARLFHSSPPRQGYIHAAHALLRAATILKSAEALTYINLLFRLSVSLLPITIKKAVMARRAALASLAAGGAGGAAVSMPLGATIFKIVSRVALALPFVLLGAVLLASLERTPITGRWRLLLLNDKEEQEIVQKVLEAGTSEQASNDMPVASAGESRDWLAIMRAVLGEEGTPAGTLLGGKVLDSRQDWRAQLVESVLSKLEASIPLLAIQSAGEEGSSIMPIALSIQPPPLEYPLAKHTRTHHLQRKNSVIVIDRPESNAFSFGFFGCVDQPEPGVIIVFTGAIDEIMQAGMGGGKGRNEQEEGKLADLQQAVRAYGGALHGEQLEQELRQSNEPSWLRSFFSSFIPVSSGSTGSKRARGMGPAGSQVVVSKEQEEALAVLLAHELAHLVLSHTIESYASTTLLWPQLEKLGWDMLRVIIYPITAILGPFVQDAISATVKVGIEESGGLLPALTSSCESRKLEHEADIVALRLLANAGIDPRSALDFWEERLSKTAPGSLEATSEGGKNRPHWHGNHAHAHSDHATSSFVKTHPADGDRIAVIRKELARWQKR